MSTKQGKSSEEIAKERKEALVHATVDKALEEFCAILDTEDEHSFGKQIPSVTCGVKDNGDGVVTTAKRDGETSVAVIRHDDKK